MSDNTARGFDLFARPGCLGVELYYPRTEQPPDRVRAIEIGLTDVRAADSIMVSYDFDRDGWVVKQASTFQWEVDDQVRAPDWQEVAFIKAWARQRPEEQE